MGTDSNLGFTAGSGATIDTFQVAAGDHQQIIREARASASTSNVWTVTTTGQSLQIAADISRVAIIMINYSTSRVFLRFDSTIPTATTADWYLDPMDRYEVPNCLVELGVSMLGTTASGTVQSRLATES
jgi:hypothetical protein